jgi:hypothetical protein
MPTSLLRCEERHADEKRISRFQAIAFFCLDSFHDVIGIHQSNLLNCQSILEKYLQILSQIPSVQDLVCEPDDLRREEERVEEETRTTAGTLARQGSDPGETKLMRPFNRGVEEETFPERRKKRRKQNKTNFCFRFGE